MAAPGGRLIAGRALFRSVGMLASVDAGDMLFVDSSQVSRTGSDVNRIVLQLLPRIEPGAYVRFHHFFIPADYPWAWIEMGPSWNERHLLQAFLEFNPCFRVAYGCAIARGLHPRECVASLATTPGWELLAAAPPL